MVYSVPALAEVATAPHAPVRLRFDDGEPEQEKWQVNRTGEAAFRQFRRSYQVKFFKKMLQHKTLYFGFLVNGVSSEQVAEFNLAGLAEAERAAFPGACGFTTSD
jgi:hypothetical protein